MQHDVFGTLLKQQREKRGFTEKEVAERAGLDPAHYCKLEKGLIRHPQLKTRNKLRSVLWPESGSGRQQEVGLAPDSLPLEEFLDKVREVLERGEAAGLRAKSVSMAEWVQWLHHAVLELQSHY